MRLYEILKEEKSQVAVMTFGRMNPPTRGHQKLISVVNDTASKNNADAYVVASQSTDKKRNPIDFDTKMALLGEFFPDVDFSISPQVRTPFDALETLGDMGYSKVIMVVGSDRIDMFQERVPPYIKTYNPDVDPDKDLGIDEFELVSAGERDPDADGVDSVSASTARELAANGERETFIKQVAPEGSPRTQEALYNAVRKGMGVE